MSSPAINGHLRVVVVGGGPGLCDRVRQLGATITLVDTAAGYDTALVRTAERTVIGEYDDPTLVPLLRAMHHEQPFSAVLSLTEYGLLPAAQIAAALELPALPPETVARTRDKHAMREWLRRAGFSTTASALVRRPEDRDEILAVATAQGFPVVVKPRRGKGSEHVSLLRAPDDVVALPAIDDDYVVEPFLSGPEFSVEAFSRAGAHHVIAVTGKLTTDADASNPFVEVGHVVPAPIPPADTAAISDYVQRFLSVMGITEGVSHTEVRLTATGPEVIETHTRVGGDSIPTLVRHATGYDLLDLAAQWPLDPDRAYAPATTVAGAAAIRFFTPDAGTVVEVDGIERWRGAPGVLTLHLPVQVGDRIATVRDSSSRVGYVVATAATAAAAIDLCDQVIAGVRIGVRP